MRKECPMCGESMSLHDRKETRRVPGTSETKVHEYREWVCPECDYFEEFVEEAEPKS